MGLFSDAAPRIPTPLFSLAPGQSWLPPVGWYWYRGTAVATLQRYDPIAQLWRSAGHDTVAEKLTYFDGITTRIANPTGCPVAAVVTTAGSGYATAPTVTASAGASSWTAIVGGAISTAATIAAAGSNYQYPPIILFDQPPNPGIQAAATTTIANGTLSTITFQEQGAGYIYPPTAVILNDPRDTQGSGAQVVVSITGAQTVTGLICTNYGNAITSGTVPTLSFSSGSAAATAVMDWCVTGVSITTAGAGYTSAAGALTATAGGGYVTATPAYLGVATAAASMRYWPAVLDITTNSSGGMSAVGAIIDGGRYQGVPTPIITAAQSPTTTGVLALTMGGTNAVVYLVPAQQ